MSEPLKSWLGSALETVPGDALRACLAYCLNLEVDEVPDFGAEGEPWLNIQTWLGERGLFALRLQVPASNMHMIPDGSMCLLTGPNPRGVVDHTIVVEWGEEDIRLLHDPHPDNIGFGEGNGPKFVTFLAQRWRSS